MKHLFLFVATALSLVGLTGCVDLDTAMMGGGGGYGSDYEPGYSSGYRPNYGSNYGPGYSSGYGSGNGYGSSGYGSGYRPQYGNNYGYSHHEDHDHDHDHHTSSSNKKDNDYFGGPRAWYESGRGIGKKDRREHKNQNYRAHKTQYDGRTEREFARGYSDGFNGR
jgi:hypothetical protein